MTRFRFLSAVCMTFVIFGILFTYGCQRNTMPVEGVTKTSLSVEPEYLFEVIREYVTTDGDMLVFSGVGDDDFFEEPEDGEDDIKWAIKGEFGDKIKFGKLVGDDARDMWGGWAIGAALNKKAAEPDCWVSIHTSIGDGDEIAFAACWIGVLQDCTEGALLIQKGDQYHVYSFCG